MKCLAILLILATATYGQRRKLRFGPKGRLIQFDVINCYEGQVSYVADIGNLCWYWQCVANKQGIFDLVPRRCALGSKMPYSYQSGRTNPCLINFNTQVDFDCTRTDDKFKFEEPKCLAKLNCKHNGTAKYEENICWCECPEEWRGASDCSLPTKKVEATNATKSDFNNCWKNEPPCDLVNGCEHGGVCHNTCKDFWCDCPVPFTAGKRCESFSCETNPCKNGGTCDRGDNEQDEVNLCKCPDGWTGLLCEVQVGGGLLNNIGPKKTAASPAAPTTTAATAAPTARPTTAAAPATNKPTVKIVATSPVTQSPASSATKATVAATRAARKPATNTAGATATNPTTKKAPAATKIAPAPTTKAPVRTSQAAATAKKAAVRPTGTAAKTSSSTAPANNKIPAGNRVPTSSRAPAGSRAPSSNRAPAGSRAPANRQSS